jgi:hypothetical protein
MVCIIFSPSQ